MSNFRDSWTLEMAMDVVQQKNVDGETWSEAVKWLLLYGPPEVRSMLQQASGHATTDCFPELTATGYTEDGQPCYDVKALAATLGISEAEVGQKINELQSAHGLRQLFAESETLKVH